jgi:hypothetical protein
MLCLATVVLWVRSYSYADHLVFWNDSKTCGYLCTVRGELRIVVEPAFLRWSGPGIFTVRSDSVGGLAMKSYRTSVTLPLWLISIAIVAFTIWRKRRRRRDPTACPTCGYNLTANTSGICPECGTPVARKV